MHDVTSSSPGSGPMSSDAGTDASAGEGVARSPSHERSKALPTYATLAFALLALMWTVLVRDLAAHARSERVDARLHLEMLAGVGSHAVQSSARAADLLLIDLRHEWVQGRAGFQQAIEIRRQRAPIRSDFEVTVLDANGVVLLSTLAANRPGADMRDLAAFRRLRDRGADELLVARHGQATQFAGSHLDFARPLLNRDGVFAGAVICAVGSDYLLAQLREFDLGPGGSMTVMSSDGDVLVQLHRAGDSGAAELVRPVHVTGHALPDPALLATDGFAQMSSAPDAPARLVAWRNTDGYPLALAVGTPADTLNEALAQMRWRYLGAGAFLSVAISAGLYWLIRHETLRDRTARERLRHERELMRAHAAVTRSERELRELSVHQLAAKETERKRIAQEIHDELGQRLTVHRLDLAMLPDAVKTDPPTLLPARVQDLKNEVDAILSIARDIAHKLRPGALDMGLAAAAESLLRDFSAKLGIPCELINRLPSGLTLDEMRTTGAFRIMQEAITNAARHAGARRILVALSAADGHLMVRVHDDGSGFDTDAPAGSSFGLSGMRERAAALGGTLEVVSSPGLGTSVESLIPLSGGAPRAGATAAEECRGKDER